MAIILVILQISLCITLTMAQQPAPTNSSVIWLYQPTFVYNLDSRYTSLPHHQRRNHPIAVRDDYTHTPGIGAHKFHTKAVKWNMARKICENEGAHLAIVNSAKEAQVIGDLFARSGPHLNSQDSNYAHIGFHDLYEEGEFVTIDGKSLATVGYYEWQSGNPNNYGNNENCGSVYRNGQLNDITCAKSVAFVCELPDVN